MSDLTNDDLLSELSSMPNKKGGKKKGGATNNKPKEEIKEEPVAVESTPAVDNDDLLNELSSMPSKKGKKKGGATKAQPKDEPKVEEPAAAESTPAVDNDDLLNELSSMPSKKGKKKGGATKAQPKEEESPKEEINVKKEEETNQDKEDADEADDDQPEEKGDKKKKKVVKKKKKKEDPFLKILQEQAKKKKELEEKLQREAEEAERRRQEEEEIQRKLEEEKRLEEEKIKKAEQDRLKELSTRGIKTAADLKELDMKAQQTLENLKKQGFENMDDFLKSVSAKPHVRKPKKKTPAVTTQKVETKEAEEEVDTKEEPEAEDKPEPVSEELLKHAEKEVNFNLNKNTTEALDDWENFEEEESTTTIKTEETSTNANVKSINEIKTESQVELADNKKNRTKQKEKVKQIEEPEYVPKSRLRSPVICILGHVDTGKTKILDKLRKTNVQEGEAGGITQQIGATFFPIDNFRQHLDKIPEKFRIDPKIPGFLVIDTPGHESFQNLRTRGSSLCDLAVLVVDLMHGLQKQTLDSLELLKRRKTPFIIALNKIDRVYQWKSNEWGSFRDSYEVQKKNQTKEFNDRLNKIMMQLVQSNLNVALYDENPSMREYINIVPTSAVTGEGMPDLIGMFIYLSQKFLVKKIEYKEEVQCTILEVKVLEGVGTTIDVILVNGTLKVGDKIVIGGLYGPIKTTIKILLTPHPMKEMRIKSEYETHDSISGAMGIKIFATDLENALAGSPLYVYKNEEEAEKYASEISQDFNSIVKDFLSKSGDGIMVQASTLGSLEAILSFLHDKKINIAAVGLGTLQKKDVIKLNTIHSRNENTYKENLTILAFDIKVHPEAKQYAEDNGIKIFTADIIYHLFDSYVDYEKQCIADRKKEKEREAIFPCVLKIVPNAVFNRKDPIILGVDVTEGVLKVGTPLIIPDKKLVVGVVEGIESNKKPTNNVRGKDGSVAIRIKPSDGNLTVGRQFDEKDILVSNISRNSINALKEFFRDDMTKEDWQLVIQLKKQLEII